MKALLIIAYITGTGTLSLETTELPECPVAEELKESMEEQVKIGEVKYYDVICRPLAPIGRNT